MQSDILRISTGKLQSQLWACLWEDPTRLAGLHLRGRTLILYLAKITKLIEAKIHRWEGKRQQSALEGGLFCHTGHNRDLFFTTLTSFASCWHSCFRKALSWETDSAWRPDIVQDIPSTSACYSALTQP